MMGNLVAFSVVGSTQAEQEVEIGMGFKGI
jgi:hypothetical protein